MDLYLLCVPVPKKISVRNISYQNFTYKLGVEEAFKTLVDSIISSNSKIDPKSGQREVTIKGKSVKENSVKLTFEKNGKLVDKKKKKS